jgi:hypothetical protein
MVEIYTRMQMQKRHRRRMETQLGQCLDVLPLLGEEDVMADARLVVESVVVVQAEVVEGGTQHTTKNQTSKPLKTLRILIMQSNPLMNIKRREVGEDAELAEDSNLVEEELRKGVRRKTRPALRTKSLLQ